MTTKYTRERIQDRTKGVRLFSEGRPDPVQRGLMKPRQSRRLLLIGVAAVLFIYTGSRLIEETGKRAAAREHHGVAVIVGREVETPEHGQPRYQITVEIALEESRSVQAVAYLTGEDWAELESVEKIGVAYTLDRDGTAARIKKAYLPEEKEEMGIQD